MESAITAKGQATIPKAIREYLGLKPGDRIKFFLHPNGSVVLLPKLPVSTLRGIVKPKKPPATALANSRCVEIGDDRARYQRPHSLPGAGRSGSVSEGDGNHRAQAQ